LDLATFIFHVPMLLSAGTVVAVNVRTEAVAIASVTYQSLFILHSPWGWIRTSASGRAGAQCYTWVQRLGLGIEQPQYKELCQVK
jgi:hypothetical protein